MINIFKALEFNMIKKKRLDLKNSDFTIISSNCLGGVISHKLGLKFMSPTVNLFYRTQLHLLSFVRSLPFYFEQPLWRNNGQVVILSLYVMI